MRTIGTTRGPGLAQAGEPLNGTRSARGWQMLQQREIDLEALADIRKFEELLQENLAGNLPDEVFRVFRLNNGIYGQRQGGHNQMVRVKIPHGSVTAEQFDMFAHIAETYSRGWAH